MSGPHNAGDIPTFPILRFLSELGKHGRWATNQPGYDNSIHNAMPPGTPNTVAMSKMRRLFRKGLAIGIAGKGDRGDWEITDKGRLVLEETVDMSETEVEAL